MSISVESIQKNLKYAGALHVNIKTGTAKPDKPFLSEVDFILDIAGLAGGIPESFLIQNVKNHHNVSGSDRVLIYPVESFDEALEILRHFSLAYNYALTTEDINGLKRNQTVAERYMIFIIERLYFR